MSGINQNFVNTYINYKKDGLNKAEMDQLKKMAESGNVDPKAAQSLSQEINKDGKIDQDEQKLLQVIGQGAKDQSTAKKFESAIDPTTTQVSQLIELGFKQKLDAVANVSRANDKKVSEMSTSDKVVEALKRSVKYMPESLRGKVEQLFTPTNLAIMGGTIAAYAASHAFGVGEAADVVLGAVGYLALGSEALDVAKDLYDFTKGAVTAKTEKELEAAAQSMAKGASTVIVDAATFFASKKAMEKVNGTRINIDPPNNFAFAGVGGSVPVSVFPAISITRVPATAVGIATAGSVLGPTILMAKGNNNSGGTNETPPAETEPQIKIPNNSQLKSNGIARIDRANTNLKGDVTHAHLASDDKIAVDVFGRAHHRASEGHRIPNKIADYLRSLGFKIAPDNIIKPRN